MFEKFKVWCVEHNEWEKHEVAIVTNGDLVHILPGRVIPLRRETHKICWSTGEVDKNNKLIYKDDYLSRGDTVWVVDREPTGEWIAQREANLGTIKYSVKTIAWQCEVIGNINSDKESMELLHGAI